MQAGICLRERAVRCGRAAWRELALAARGCRIYEASHGRGYSGLRRRLDGLEPGRGGARLVRAGGGYRLVLGADELDMAVFGDLVGRGRAAARAGDTETDVVPAGR